MATLSDGMYQISLPGERVLSAFARADGAPLRLTDPSPAVMQQWQVRRTDNDTYTIREGNPPELYVGCEGPVPEVLACEAHEPREWQLTAGEVPDTFIIGVSGTELRLAQSSRSSSQDYVILTQPVTPDKQTWTFRSVE